MATQEELIYQIDVKLGDSEEKIDTLAQKLRKVEIGLDRITQGKSSKIRIDGSQIDATEKQLRSVQKKLQDTINAMESRSLNKIAANMKKTREEIENTTKSLNNLAMAYEKSMRTGVSLDRRYSDNARLERRYIEKLTELHEQAKQLGIQGLPDIPKAVYTQSFIEYSKAIQAAEQNIKANKQYQKEEERRIKENSRLMRESVSQRAKLEQQQAATEARNAKLREQSEQRYLAEIVKQNRMKASGNQLDEIAVRLTEQKARLAKRDFVNAGGNAADLPASLFENFDLEDYNRKVRDANAIRWSTKPVASYASALSQLRAEQERLYSTYMKDPSKKNLASFMAIQQRLQSVRKEYEQYQKTIDRTGSFLDSFMIKVKSHFSWIVAGAGIGMMFGGFTQLVDTIQEIDTAMAGIKQVMPAIEGLEDSNVFGSIADQQHRASEEARALIGIAAQYGESVNKVMDAARSIGRMYGQGVNGQANTNLMVRQAAKMATADAFDMLDATRGLESAMSQWNLQTEDTQQLLVNTNRILDVWTKTAHRGAASAQDIGQAIELAGTAAAQAGVSFEFFNALVATGVRATARSGNEIGNAIKSMMASMQTGKSIKALEDFGIQIYNIGEDGTKTMRSMQDIILDVSLALQTTDKNTNKLLMTLSGGKFQFSKVSAMLKDYDELLRVVSETSESAGFTDEQVQVQLATLSRKMQTLKDDISALAVSFGENNLLPFMISLAEHLDNIVVGISKLPPQLKYVAEGFVAMSIAGKGIEVISRKWNTFTAAFDMARGKMSTTKNAATELAAAQRLAASGYITQEQLKAIADGNSARATAVKTQAVTRDTIATNADTSAIKNNSRFTSVNTGDVVNNTRAVSANTLARNQNATSALSGIRNNAKMQSAVLAAGTGAMVAAGRFAGLRAAIAAMGGPVGALINVLTIVVPMLTILADVTGDAENAAKRLTESTDDAIAKAQNAGQEVERNKTIIGTLAKQYNELAESIERENVSEEEKAKKTELMEKISERVAGILNANTDQFVENGRISIDAIVKLNEAQKKAAVEELERQKTLIEAAYEATDKEIENVKTRIKALNQEAKAADGLRDVYNALYGMIGNAKIELGKALKAGGVGPSPLTGLWSYLADDMITSGEKMLETNTKEGGAFINGSILGNIFDEYKGVDDLLADLDKLQNEKTEQEKSWHKAQGAIYDINTPIPPFDPGIEEDEDGKKEKKAAKDTASRIDALRFRELKGKQETERKRINNELAQLNYQRDTYGADEAITAAIQAKRAELVDSERAYQEKLKAMYNDVALKANAIRGTDFLQTMGNDLGNAILEEAEKQVGGEYVFGGNAFRGTDCSGFVQQVFDALGLEISRTADIQAEDFKAKGAFHWGTEGMKPGDVWFSAGSGVDVGDNGIGHVGFYAGNGMTTEARGRDYGIGHWSTEGRGIIGYGSISEYAGQVSEIITSKIYNNLKDIVSEEDWNALSLEGKLEFVRDHQDELKDYQGVIGSLNNLINVKKELENSYVTASEELLKAQKARVEDVKKKYDTAAKEAGYKATSELAELGLNASDVDKARIELEKLDAELESLKSLLPELTEGTQEYKAWLQKTQETEMSIAEKRRQYNREAADQPIKYGLEDSEANYKRQVSDIWGDWYTAERELLKEQQALLQKRLENLTQEYDAEKQKAEEAHNAEVGKIEAEIALLKIRKEAGEDVSKELDDENAKLEKEAEEWQEVQTYGTVAMRDVKTKINETEDELDNLDEKIRRVEKQLRETIDSGVSQMFEDVLLEGKTFADGWKSLWKDIARIAIRQLMNIAMNRFWVMVASWFGGGAKDGGLVSDIPGSAVGEQMATGGRIPRKAQGGRIPGYADGKTLTARAARTQSYIRGAGTGKSDSILAYLANKDKFVYLSNGEYVMTAEATKRIGVNNLDAMNAGHFAEGGALNPIPYVPTLNPRTVERAEKLGTGRSMTDRLLAEQNRQMNEQNALLRSFGKGEDEGGNGQVVVLNTHASPDDVMRALQENPRALNAILGRNNRMGFRG